MFGIETGRVICAACRELFSYRQVVWSFGRETEDSVASHAGKPRKQRAPATPGH